MQFEVGAVVSQEDRDGEIHPYAFFYKRLSKSFTERIYDVGGRELLAVKLALEEWRYWLEGSKTTFLVWTDHRILEHLKSAKKPNPRQSR